MADQNKEKRDLLGWQMLTAIKKSDWDAAETLLHENAEFLDRPLPRLEEYMRAAMDRDIPPDRLSRLIDLQNLSGYHLTCLLGKVKTEKTDYIDLLIAKGGDIDRAAMNISCHSVAPAVRIATFAQNAKYRQLQRDFAAATDKIEKLEGMVEALTKRLDKMEATHTLDKASPGLKLDK